MSNRRLLECGTLPELTAARARRKELRKPGAAFRQLPSRRGLEIGVKALRRSGSVLRSRGLGTVQFVEPDKGVAAH
ncbi:hypothetical protein MRX96_002761 [Rhipicephalus microplus]